MLWSHDARAGGAANFHGNLILTAGLVVAGTDSGADGRLYALDPETGTVRWERAAPGGFPSDPVRVGDDVVAVTMGGDVVSLRLRDGRETWRFEAGPGERVLRSSVAAAGDRVVTSLPSGRVLALGAHGGKLLWDRDLGVRLNTSLALIGDAVYVGDLDGGIHRLALSDGERVGFFQAAGPVYGSLLAAEGRLLALWGEDTLACLDASLERVEWTRRSPTKWSSFQLLVLDGAVVVGSDAGLIQGFALADGEPRWSLQVQGEVKGIGAAGELLVAGTLAGRVYGIRLSSPGSGGGD